MAEISKIKIGSNTYDIKDAVARARIVGGIHYIGKTNTALTDGATTKPIKKYDAETSTWVDYEQAIGDIVIYEKAEGRHLEFIWNGEHWDEFGSTGELGNAAFMTVEEKNLEHTHTITNEDTTVDVALALEVTSDGSKNVVTDASISLDGGTAKVGKGGAVTVTGQPYIVVPDLKNNKYTPEGTVVIADGSKTATTDGGVDYGTTNSEKELNVTGGTTTLTHTNSATSTTTIDGTNAKYSISGTINPAVTVSDITATVNSSNASCGVVGTNKKIAEVNGEVLVLQETALGSVSAGSYKEVTSVTVIKPTVGVQIGAVELEGTGITGLTATTNTTVSIDDHSLVHGKVILPELVYTAPKYIKWGKATFTGTAKETFVEYSNNYGGNHYAAQYRQGMYKQYDAASSDSGTVTCTGNIPTGTLALNITKQAITGSVTYKKAASITGKALTGIKALAQKA